MTTHAHEMHGGVTGGRRLSVPSEPEVDRIRQGSTNPSTLLPCHLHNLSWHLEFWKHVL